MGCQLLITEKNVPLGKREIFTPWSGANLWYGCNVNRNVQDERKRKIYSPQKSGLPGRYENTSIRGSGASLFVRPSSQQDDGYKRRKRKNLPSSKSSLPDQSENISIRGAGLPFGSDATISATSKIKEREKSSLVKKAASRQDEKNSAWKRGCREA